MPSLKIDIAETYEAMSRLAAKLIITELTRRPNLLLCASAGGTPTRTYELLVAKYRRQPRLFERLRVLQIDEWAGLPPDSTALCRHDLEKKLLEPLRVDSKRYEGFNSSAGNLQGECCRVGTWLADNGPIDICILGLGVNGHVAMNEPANEFAPGAHVARLAKSSQKHPLLKELSKKPTFGLTLGIGEILQARKTLLLISGPQKRQAFERLMEPRVTTQFPASLLWLHPDAIVLGDAEAAGFSKERTGFRRDLARPGPHIASAKSRRNDETPSVFRVP